MYPNESVVCGDHGGREDTRPNRRNVAVLYVLLEISALKKALSATIRSSTV